MDLQAIFSDNQLAVIGCFVALGFCGSIAALSFHFGPAGQKSSQANERLPVRTPLPDRTAPAGQSTRRAA